jgi:hypothetical protein
VETSWSGNIGCFQVTRFHTYVYARKSLNPSICCFINKIHSETHTIHHSKYEMLYICSCDCIETNIIINFNFYVPVRKKRVTGKQPMYSVYTDSVYKHSHLDYLSYLPCFTCM